jgi:hypothetical protein
VGRVLISFLEVQHSVVVLHHSFSLHIVDSHDIGEEEGDSMLLQLSKALSSGLAPLLRLQCSFSAVLG